MPGRSLYCVIAACVVVVSVSCAADERVKTTQPAAPVNANVSPPAEPPVTWTAAVLDDWLEGHQPLKHAWYDFQRSQQYRLAQPADRNPSPTAGQSRKYSTNQLIPFLVWWGAEAYEGDDFLVAIVVDPSRTDTNRYGLVVIAAPESDGGKYKPYWVLREEDLESYRISGASGTVFVECIGRDGTEETKRLAWYRSRREFRLK